MRYAFRMIQVIMRQITNKIILRICFRKKISYKDQLRQETLRKNLIHIKMEVSLMKMIKRLYSLTSIEIFLKVQDLRQARSIRIMLVLKKKVCFNSTTKCKLNQIKKISIEIYFLEKLIFEFKNL
jgi:hypothetical protein